MPLIADPPGRRQVHVAIAVAAIVGIMTAAVVPFATLPGPYYPRMVLGYGVAEVMGYVSTSILLLSEAAILSNAGRAMLGAAFLFAASMFIPSVALMPEQFEARGVLHGTWLMLFLDAGFGLLVLLYVFRAHHESTESPPIGQHIIGVGLLVATGCGLTWALVAQLPPVPQVGGYGSLISLTVGPPVLLLDAAALIAVGVRLRARTPADLWLMLVLLSDCIEVGLTLLGNERFTIGWNFARSISLAGSFAMLLPVSMEITTLFRRLAEANRLLDRMAYADALTGLANRRRFDVTLTEEYRRARRTGAPLALIMLDIDQFKQLNDAYGHPTGDECLRRVATVLGDTARRTGDMAARVGGEEFAVLLAATDLQQAAYIAEQIRSGVEALNIPNVGADRAMVTVSAGVAVLTAGSGLDDRWLMCAADRALYEAKAAGRDRVMTAPPVQREATADA